MPEQKQNWNLNYSYKALASGTQRNERHKFDLNDMRNSQFINPLSLKSTCGIVEGYVFQCLHISNHDFFGLIFGIFLPKLFWPTVRKNCSSDREKVLEFGDEGREFAKFLILLEQFIQTVKAQSNFWSQNAFSTCSWRFLISSKLEQ